MSIYQRGENWYIDFTFKGQRIRESVGPSRKGAEKVIAKKKAEIAENRFLDVRKDPDPVKFHDFGKEYLQWARANKKPSSWNREISTMRRLDREFGEMNLHEITTWQIEKWKLKRKTTIRRTEAVIGSLNKKNRRTGEEKEIWYVEYDRPNGKKKGKRVVASKEQGETYLSKVRVPVRPATINRELCLLKHMYTKAVEWGKCSVNPTKKVKLLKGEVKRVRFLLPEEIHRLISNCADHLKPVVILAVHTGMRRGEIMALEWDRIDLERGIITLLDTKNHERRDIPMNETVKAILKALEREEKGPHVFCDDSGRVIDRVDHSFHTALKKTGIEDFKFHDLRHTFASNLVMNGEDLNTVRELLGHKDLTMTLRYSHLAPGKKNKAVSIWDRIMSQNPPQSEIPQKVVSLRG